MKEEISLKTNTVAPFQLLRGSYRYLSVEILSADVARGPERSIRTNMICTTRLI